MMQFNAIVMHSFREAIDRKVFWVMILMSVIVAASMASVGFSERGVDFLFGTWTVESDFWSLRSDTLHERVGALIVGFIADNYLGKFGMLFALITTASIFPALMEPGAVDVIASKPIDRKLLFLYKYLSAMIFILLQATVFVGITFLVMGLRWRYWPIGYWSLVPLTVLMFSYLFSLCALFGTWVRRAMPALILTLIAWFCIFGVQSAHAVLIANPDFDKTGKWTRMVTAMHWATPKTQDIPEIARRIVGAADFVDIITPHADAMSDTDRSDFEHAAEGNRKLTASIDPLSSIASSLAVEAFVVFLALRRFNRMDL